LIGFSLLMKVVDKIDQFLLILLLRNCFLTGFQDLAGLAGFELVHDEEAAWDLALGLCSLAVCDGWISNVAMKERAE